VGRVFNSCTFVSPGDDVFGGRSIRNNPPMDDKEGRLWIIAILVAWDLVFIYVMYSTLLIPTIIQVDLEASFLLKSPLSTLRIDLGSVKKVQRDSDRDWEIWYGEGKSSLQFFREDDLNPFFDWLVSKKGINVYPR